MSYAEFLVVFLVAPILVIGCAAARRLRVRHVLSCAAVCLIAFVYTAPWDNYAAKVRLWWYDPKFAPPSHFILYLPWEEYAFYALQGILVCLVCILLARVLRASDGSEL